MTFNKNLCLKYPHLLPHTHGPVFFFQIAPDTPLFSASYKKLLNCLAHITLRPPLS